MQKVEIRKVRFPHSTEQSKIQDGRQRVKKGEARKKAAFVLDSFPLSRSDFTWDFHQSNPYLS